MSSEQISVMGIGSCKNTRCSLQMQLFRVNMDFCTCKG
jgi:hypothetical protein